MESSTKSLQPGRELAESRLIYKVRCGSHAYGTNIATSDEDYAGIFIPPVESFFGLHAFDMLSDQSEEDHAYYSLRKYANLAVANNPNVLELLFVRDSDILLATSQATNLRRHRHLFLSQRCQKTFVGYAKAQLHRIRTHTKWLGQELHDLSILEPLFKSGRVSANWVAWRFS
jgi:predicted nucleotidyltransferase